MTGRAAQAAEQSDPDRNPQFRRWPANATGPDVGARLSIWLGNEEAAPRGIMWKIFHNFQKAQKHARLRQSGLGG